MKVRFFTIAILLIYSIVSVSAQKQLQEILSSDKGLSSTFIGDILQDNNGNLWIATENGLNRYNGVKLTHYFHDENNPYSLNSNYVRTLFVDKDGQLFIGTRAGIQIYNPATDSFSLTSTFTSGEPSYNIVNHIIQRRNGDIIASGNILCTVKIVDGNPQIDSIEAGEFSFVAEEVFEDSRERLWISKNGLGVMRIDPDGTTHYYSNNLGDAPFVLCINEDRKGNILAGTIANGVFLFDENKDDFFSISDESCIVRKIFVHNATETFICTDGKGLKVFDNTTGRISDYPIEMEMVESNKAKVHCITKDNQGNLWMALYQHGALMIPARKSPFHFIGPKSFGSDIIGNCCIMAVKAGSKGETYVGTDNDGLYIVSADKTSSVHFSSDNNTNIPSIVIGLFEDSERNLWIGSYGAGAYILDLATMKSHKVEGIYENKEKKEPASNVYDFVEDNNKRIWIATMGGGLHCYDLRQKRMVECDTISHNISSWICCIDYSAATNTLFIGTYDGLWKIGLNNPENENTQILSTTIIHDICVDSDGVVWAATSDGLARWEANGNSEDVRIFTPNDGIPSNICYAIEEDVHNALWISTGHGLARMDRKTFALTCFYVEDGIQGNEFSKNASTFDPRTKELYFGGVNGVTWFSPTDSIENSYKWEVYISDMYIAGIPVRVGTKSGNRNIIDAPVFEAHDFYLSHNDNAFTLEIGTNDLSGSDKKIIYYAMDAEKWVALPKGTEQVSFSNLPPGTYTFKMKVVDGAIESDVRQIRIHIRPAWWMSWWAVLIVLCIIAYVIYYSLEQVRHRRLMRLKMYHHIQSERNSESKIQFLTNVSHKIRTPMTLILNPLQDLIDTDCDEGRQAKYQRMKRNADRIMTLVGEFMDVKKFDRTKLESQIERWHDGHDPQNAQTTEPVRIEQPANDNEENLVTILIAEDDKEIRTYLETELSTEYRVITCENGALALDYIMKEVPNIIVSDVMMPEMDGFTLVKRIRQNIQFNDIPIILLTAKSMQEDNIKGLELGADAYITKPFDMRVLRQNIASLLKSRQTLKNIYSGNQAQEGKVNEIKTRTPDEILIEKVMRVINDNISNSDLSVEKIADEVGVSRVHLHRKLKQLTNQSTRDLIRNQRITLAAKILKEKKMPISEVAYHVGFSSPAHFTTAFKAMYGMSPTQFCQSHVEK